MPNAATLTTANLSATNLPRANNGIMLATAVLAVTPFGLVASESVITFRYVLTNWSKPFGRRCVIFYKIDSVCNKSTNEDSMFLN